VRSSEQTATLT